MRGLSYVFPAPFLSLMIEGAAEAARDVSLGARYNNYGIHGTGIATAADALEAIDRYVFTEKTVDAHRRPDAFIFIPFRPSSSHMLWITMA